MMPMFARGAARRVRTDGADVWPLADGAGVADAEGVAVGVGAGASEEPGVGVGAGAVGVDALGAGSGAAGEGELSAGTDEGVSLGDGEAVGVAEAVAVGSGVCTAATAVPPVARRPTVSSPLTVRAHQRVTRLQGEGEEKSTTNNNPDTSEVGFAPRCAGLPPFNTNQAARLPTVNRGAGETYGACVAAVPSL
jgi:hypothetical protein